MLPAFAVTVLPVARLICRDAVAVGERVDFLRKKVRRSRKWLILIPYGSHASIDMGRDGVRDSLPTAVPTRLDLDQRQACLHASCDVMLITHPGAWPQARDPAAPRLEANGPRIDHLSSQPPASHAPPRSPILGRGQPHATRSRASPGCGRLPASTLHALAAQTVLHRVPAGSLLFEQAETPVFAQFLLAGSIELLGVRDQVETLIELLRPVDLIIPAAVLGGQPYLMRARVYEEAHLLLVPADAFRMAVAADPALSCAILGCMVAQFRRQVRLQKNLKLRSTEERVRCLSRFAARIDRCRHHRAPASREAAHRIATRDERETISRALSGMARFGMFVRGDTVQVVNPQRRCPLPARSADHGTEPISPLQDREP